MRKLLFLFVALFATTSLWAYDFQSGDLYYNITNDTRVPYTVDVTRPWSNYAGLTTANIPETVTYNGITYSVTSIGDDTFRDCSSLTSVIIPNSVTSIGEAAFYKCSSLTSVNIPNSITSIGGGTFYGCSSLTSITIPESVTSIGVHAFSDCSSLTSITIPNSVTSIGDYAFDGCSSLPVEDNLRYADTYLVAAVDKKLSTYSIKEGTKWIARGAFYNCSSLTSITIPNSVTSIGSYAFYDCSSLTSITIPDSVTSIGDDTFRYCLSLTSITIPNSVTSIGDWAFHVCSSLTSITIPNGVTRIGDVAFMACSSLTSITIPNSVTSIGRGIFRGCRFTKENFVNNSTLDAEANNYWGAEFVDAEIDGLLIRNDTVIDCRMFVTSLTSITIPNSVTYIGERAFENCSSLTSITIPNSVTYIGERAFDNCSSLNEVILGTGLETVKEYAFAGCSKLQDVYCYAIEPPTAYDSSFSQYNAFLYIPCENKKVYMLDEVFGNFKYIECISSDEVKTNDVVITPSTNDVTITWPAEAGADTYTIVIKKGNEVFCTLTFNADGQLLNIAYAPGRDSNNHGAQYAEQAGNGYRFTVTGLEEGTHYAYNIDVRDAANKTIKSYSGEFTAESMTAVENITTNNANIQKILRDGQLLILRDGVEYTIMGQEL